MKKELFVNKEIAKFLKGKNFDELCIKYYLEGGQHSIINGKDKFLEGANYNLIETRISCPLYQQVLDWFREKHKISISIISHDIDNIIFHVYQGNIFIESDDLENAEHNYEDYYKCLNQAIEEAIKLI